MQSHQHLLALLAGVVVGLLVLGLSTVTRHMEYIRSSSSYRASIRPPLPTHTMGAASSSARDPSVETLLLRGQLGQQADVLQWLAQDVDALKSVIALRNSTVVDEQEDSSLIGLHEELKRLGDLLMMNRKDKNVSSPPEDTWQHNDDNRTALHLYDTVRVLCYIPVSDDTVDTKVKHILNTWGKRCNKLLFFAEKSRSDVPVVGLGIKDAGSYKLSAKMFDSYYYLYKHHLDDYDWFMKADTDTYVVAENLRYMLSDYDPSQAIYFGHHFKVLVKNGYMSGGAGYVMSREVLRRFGEQGYMKKCSAASGTEDVDFGQCMAILGVSPGDSRDSLGRSRFHAFRPSYHILSTYPSWYYAYDKYGGKGGMDSMSDYAISFHYVKTDDMYMLEYYIYHVRPYGIIAGLQSLNHGRNGTTRGHVIGGNVTGGTNATDDEPVTLQMQRTTSL